MRLINVDTYELEEFFDETQVKYVILSHRWETEEVLFDHMVHRFCTPNTKHQRQGWSKVERCCRQAKHDGYKYVWIDTCCINKESSAELQEAINSMFSWYTKAEICYAYLSDVGDIHGRFEDSVWFRRGWTLQELLAPEKVVFWDHSWNYLGTRNDLATAITQITKIEPGYLEGSFASQESRPWDFEIMSWAASRKTSRIEDRAYSLFGLFNVNLPLLYGEGLKSFQRLQEAILSRSYTATLFFWTGVLDQEDEDQCSGLLARSPDNFGHLSMNVDYAPPMSQVSITATGIKTTFTLLPVCPTIYFASVLPLFGDSGDSERPTGIFLKHIENSYYRRVRYKERDLAQYDRLWSIDCSLLGLSTAAPHHQNDKILEDEKHEKRNEREIIVLNQPIPVFDARSEAIPYLMVRHSSCTKTAFTCSENHEDLVHRMMGTAWQVQRGIGRPGVWWVYPSAEQANTPELPVHRLIVAYDHDFMLTIIMIIDEKDEEVPDQISGDHFTNLAWIREILSTSPVDSRFVPIKFEILDQQDGHVLVHRKGKVSFRANLPDGYGDGQLTSLINVRIKGSSTGYISLRIDHLMHDDSKEFVHLSITSCKTEEEYLSGQLDHGIKKLRYNAPFDEILDVFMND